MKLKLLFLAFSLSLSCPAEKNNRPRIIGGQNAPSDLYAFQVSLQHLNDHFCGGVLISNRFVLTAAHCLEGVNRRETSVLVGTKNLSEGGHRIKVKRFFIHPKFDEDRYNFDIALIKLSPSRAQLKILRTIPKASLSNNYDFSQQIAWVSGWGVTSQSATPTLLQHTSVNLIKRAVCNELYWGQITPQMVCAGVIDQGGNIVGGRDSCQGDSGGPLVVERMVKGSLSRNVLIGLVSWGVGCAGKDSPGVYTNLADRKILNWVRNRAPWKLGSLSNAFR